MQLEVLDVVAQVLEPVGSSVRRVHFGEAKKGMADQIFVDVDSILRLLQLGLELSNFFNLLTKTFVFFLETHVLRAQMSQVMGLSRLGLRLANIHFFRIAAHLRLRLS